MHYCFNCEKNVDTEIKSVTETYVVMDDSVDIDSTVRYCKECGTDLFDETLDSANLEKAYSIYRERHHLLTASEIFNIRQRYQMEQIAFSLILGFGCGRIKSLERGSLPSRAENNLLVLAQNVDNFSIIVENNRDLVAADEYEAVRYTIGQILLERDKKGD